jgi:diaminohydroxyphosphoribosylaminopyrimidine deaminase/5-amino-6-(5-phosphoribosylamino)uracil reductase
MPTERHSDSPQSADVRWMRQALGLAEKTIGLASPNPVVGCVLVRDDVAVGRGAHLYDQLDHAEIVALKEANAAGLAQGATAYVTLEPCSHTGRTGPCADALIRAGVGRVVVATVDPNPAVSGRGIARLREGGIPVTVGVLAEQARQINDGFARYIRRTLPFVTLKAGLSLDGRIAPMRSPGEAATTYLTSPHSLLAVQRMRHASDAILTGIGTVLADNPLLTDRTGLPRRRPLLRVVLDSALRLPLDSRLVASAQSDLLVYTTDAASPRADALRALGIAVERAPTLAASSSSLSGATLDFGAGVGIGTQADGGWLDLRAVLVSLGERRRIVNLMAEGGGRLTRTLLGEELVDKLCLFYAPIFLGEKGVPMIAGDASLHPEISGSTLTHSGDDFCFEAYLRDPWR